MTLTALICAYHESSDPGVGLRATLPLAGRTLVERQVRLAAEAGAKPVILVIDRESPELANAFNRLRAEGLDILVVRSAGEAARAVQTNDPVLLIADGLLTDGNQVRRLIEAGGAALLTVSGHHFDDRFERIDAESCWGGLAMIDGQTLKHVAAMLQDWDLQSTLLRRAVQNGAVHVDFASDHSGDEVGALLIAAERADDLADLESSILAKASAWQGGWVSCYLLAPIEQMIVRQIMSAAVNPGQIWLGSLILILFSAIAFLQGWLLTGLCLFLLASLFDGASERLARLRRQGGDPDNWLRNMQPFAAAIASLALGWALAGASGWGSIVLAITTIAFMVALNNEQKQADVPASIFLAEPKGMGWLMLPFGATGQWVAGLGVLSLYAIGSFFWVQRYVHTPNKAVD
jgi:hypothetical protein